jgi:hypothetical protein
MDTNSTINSAEKCLKNSVIFLIMEARRLIRTSNKINVVLVQAFTHNFYRKKITLYPMKFHPNCNLGSKLKKAANDSTKFQNFSI